MIESATSEKLRRGTALVLVWVGWTSTITLAILRATNVLPMQYGALSTAAAALAIAATITRSRMRLRDTIVGAFRAGQEASRLRDEADWAQEAENHQQRHYRR